MSATGLQWVVAANALAFGGFLLLAGRAADLFGHRRLFVVGLELFAVSSLACGLAPTWMALVVARAGQGLGAALFTPAALALLTDAFPEGRGRTRALGIWGATGPIGGIVSVLGGGFLARELGWRWAFLLAVPIATMPLALAPVLLPKDRGHGASGRLDLLGALTGAGGVVLLVAGLSRATAADGPGPDALALLVVRLGLLVGFVVVERRVAAPLVPLGIFRRRGLARANLVAILHGASTNTPIVFFTLFMQDVRGISPLATGLAFLPCNLAIVVGAAAGSRMAARAGYGRTMAAGMGALVVALPLLSRLSPAGGYVGTLLPGLAMLGLGLGLAQVGIVGTATAGTGPGPAERGVAAGLVNTSAQLGTAVGLALLVGIAAARTEALTGEDAASTEALVAGYRWALLGGAGLAGVGVVVALLLRRDREPPSAGATQGGCPRWVRRDHCGR